MAQKRGHYEVNINGIRHTYKMTAEDAERVGATLIKGAPAVKQATSPKNKALPASGGETGNA